MHLFYCHIKSTQMRSSLFLIYSSTNCILKNCRLFKNFLQHKMFKTLFFGLFIIPFYMFNCFFNLLFAQIKNFKTISTHICQFPIIQKNYISSVCQKWRRVARYKIFSLTNSQYNWTSHSSHNHFVWFIFMHHYQAISSTNSF